MKLPITSKIQPITRHAKYLLTWKSRLNWLTADAMITTILRVEKIRIGAGLLAEPPLITMQGRAYVHILNIAMYCQFFK